MEKGKIAVPCSKPGGMEAPVSSHFGHCEMYTLVDITDSKVREVTTLPSIPHQHGGCMAPVNYLKDNGATCLIAGGMGMRPLTGFQQAGIDVFYGAGAATVGEAVQALLTDGLRAFSTEQTCGGGTDCQH